MDDDICFLEKQSNVVPNRYSSRSITDWNIPNCKKKTRREFRVEERGVKSIRQAAELRRALQKGLSVSVSAPVRYLRSSNVGS